MSLQGKHILIGISGGIAAYKIPELIRLLKKAGADSMITPREMLRDYMTVLNILMQNEQATFADIVGEIKLKTAVEEREEQEMAQNSRTNVPQTGSRAAFDPNDIDF